jgi:hypothetical protein
MRRAGKPFVVVNEESGRDTRMVDYWLLEVVIKVN